MEARTIDVAFVPPGYFRLQANRSLSGKRQLNFLDLNTWQQIKLMALDGGIDVNYSPQSFRCACLGVEATIDGFDLARFGFVDF